MDVLYGLIACIILITLGFLVGKSVARRKPPINKPIGILRIDNSDPDDVPYLFLEELNVDPYELKDGTYVTLQVLTKDYISHD